MWELENSERHHPDKKNKPEVVLLIPRKEHQIIHNISPVDTELSRKMRQYEKVNRLVVSQKNWITSFKKDFGTSPEIGLEKSLMLKKALLKEVNKLIKTDLEKVSHIKGLSTISLAGILARAHPNQFSSRWKFLCYCGYTQTSRVTHKYNRGVKSAVHQTVESLIKWKNKPYYDLYKKFKASFQEVYPNRKMKCHKMAMNRAGTFMLKEIYGLFQGQKVERSGTSFNSLSARSKNNINSQPVIPETVELMETL